MTDPKIVAIIQGRMSSSRLPGKILLDIAGQPMLRRVYERVRRSQAVDQVLIATTTDPSDDGVEKYCQEQGLPYFRGSQFDVLDRFYQAAKASQADIVVRVTADCPVIDPEVIDATVSALWDCSTWQEVQAQGGSLQNIRFDFTADRLPPPWRRTFPIGLDVEVCTFSGLERAWKEASQAYQREHVMPYFYDQEGRFRVKVIQHEPDYGALRWTVDTADDLELLRQIFARFKGRDDFTWLEVLALFEREPELAHINAGVRHKTAFDADDRQDAGSGKPV